MIKKYQNQKNQKGAVALILAVLLLSCVLIASLFLSNLVIQQIRLTRQTGESINAYQAADSGIEYVVYQINRGPYGGDLTVNEFYSLIDELDSNTICSADNPYWFAVNADNQASYCLEPIESEGNLIGVRAVGEFMGRTRRAVEISFMALSNPIGHWTFDQDDLDWPNNLALDISGNNFDGNIAGMSISTAPIIGQVGEALNFDGINDEINCGNDPLLKTADVAICLWLKTSYDGGSYKSFVHKDNAYAIGIKSGSLSTYDWGGGAWRDNGIINIADNSWHFCCLSVESGTGQFYVDGNLDGDSFGYSVRNQGSVLKIGGINEANGGYDEVRVYGQSLRPDQIEYLHQLE